MAFLRNDAVNRVNVHSGVQALAKGAGGLFVLVFLLQAGLSIPAVLLAQAAIQIGRFLIRPAILPLAMRWGLKPLLIAGALGLALPYIVLAEVQGVGPALIVLCVAVSLGEVFYWVSYNSYFAAIGDAEHRGHQIGAREALTAAAGIIAPLLGAWALVSVGPRWTFVAVGLLQAAAALPLLGLPNVSIASNAPGAYRSARPAVVVSALDGWLDACLLVLWPMVLFLTLGRSFAAYGGAMALAALAGAAGALWLGRRIDGGFGRRAVVVAYVLAAATVVAQAVSVGAPWLAVAANAMGALLMPLLSPAIGGVTYNLAKRSPCPLRFTMASEGGWDMGCAAACLVAAAMVAGGASLAAALLLGLPSVLAGALWLWRLYPGVVRPAPA